MPFSGSDQHFRWTRCGRPIEAGYETLRSGSQAVAALLIPSAAPTLILCGEATPPKSKAEMAAMPRGSGVDIRWIAGSLGLFEEQAEAIGPTIVSFLSE